jgi:hypothetical protein
MREHRFSTAAYRLLLRTYRREFRERFAADLEIDFLEMARTRGTAFAGVAPSKGRTFLPDEECDTSASKPRRTSRFTDAYPGVSFGRSSR